tara:strand:+ start:542 stop:682 length:141 start_codon:yes stop_codon:yes gene_type:complete
MSHRLPYKSLNTATVPYTLLGWLPDEDSTFALVGDEITPEIICVKE